MKIVLVVLAGYAALAYGLYRLMRSAPEGDDGDFRK